jgi:hypothetical protein
VNRPIVDIPRAQKIEKLRKVKKAYKSKTLMEWKLVDN